MITTVVLIIPIYIDCFYTRIYLLIITIGLYPILQLVTHKKLLRRGPPLPLNVCPAHSKRPSTRPLWPIRLPLQLFNVERGNVLTLSTVPTFDQNIYIFLQFMASIYLSLNILAFISLIPRHWIVCSQHTLTGITTSLRMNYSIISLVIYFGIERASSILHQRTDFRCVSREWRHVTSLNSRIQCVVWPPPWPCCFNVKFTIQVFYFDLFLDRLKYISFLSSFPAFCEPCRSN